MTDIQEIVNHYFFSTGLDLEDIKEQAKTGQIKYGRHTKPAKELLELTGTLEKAKEAIDIIAEWANERGLSYTIETAFKRFWEIKHLL